MEICAHICSNGSILIRLWLKIFRVIYIVNSLSSRSAPTCKLDKLRKWMPIHWFFGQKKKKNVTNNHARLVIKFNGEPINSERNYDACD